MNVVTLNARLCHKIVNQHISRFPSLSAAKGKGKGMMKEDLKGPEVCKDPERLTSYAVGVNIFKQGDDPKIKPPEEYPEW